MEDLDIWGKWFHAFKNAYNTLTINLDAGAELSGKDGHIVLGSDGEISLEECDKILEKWWDNNIPVYNINEAVLFTTYHQYLPEA